MKELGLDLLYVGLPRKVLALLIPFVLVAAGLWLLTKGDYVAAMVVLAALCFFTYPSVSHDLVHGTYRLPQGWNRFLLSLIEGLCLRSGTAYRIAHVQHHRCFPSSEDIEGYAANLSWWQALLYGIIYQPRSWMLGFRRTRGDDRRWLCAELLSMTALCLIAVMLFDVFPALAYYLILMHVGSWLFPFMTAYMPHRFNGRTEVEQTRRFRGRMAALISLEHLYHLEHHLYPKVPHQNWPELARRLDPYLDSEEAKILRLGI